MMKKLAALSLVFVLLLSACGGPSKNDEIPQDLDGKKAMLKTKKAELRELEAIVKQLEKDIADLDSTVGVVSRSLVTTQGLLRKDFTRYVEIQGAVESDQTVKVSSEIGGRLQGFTLKEGDYVKAGQVIGKVDVEQVRKSIAELETRLSLAQDVYDRQEKLWKQNIGSEVQYLQAKNNVESLKKSIETVKYQLTKEEITAPASGYVNMTFAKNGEVVGPGTPIFDIMNLSQVKVVAAVPEIYIQAVNKGEMVNIKFPALNTERKGRVTLIGNQINAQNRTFKIEIALDNAGQKLIPNLMASVQLRDYFSPNVLVLPNELIQQDVSGRSYAFVVADGAEGKVAKRVFVTIGETYNGETEILSGLKGDETVIVEGARGLVDNEPIEVQ